MTVPSKSVAKNEVPYMTVILEGGAKREKRSGNSWTPYAFAFLSTNRVRPNTSAANEIAAQTATVANIRIV